MNNYNAKFGLYASVLAIIAILGFNMVSTKAMITFSGWIGIIAIIVGMVLAVKEEKSFNKGSISFGSAFKHAWVTYLIYGVITTIFTYVFYNLIDPSLKKEIMDVTIEGMSKLKGIMGEEAYEKMIEELEKNDAFSIGKILQGLLVQLIFPGAFVAALLGLIMKKEGNPWENQNGDTPTINDNLV